MRKLFLYIILFLINVSASGQFTQVGIDPPYGFMNKASYDSLIEANKHGKTYEVINKLSDFPAPVAGVITLQDSTSYYIKGVVNIGTNKIQTGKGNIITSPDRFNNVLISTTTGNMFELGATTSPFTGFICYKIGLQCPNGTMFNTLNTGITLDFVFISNTKNIGVFNSVVNPASIAVFKSNFQTVTGTGFTLTGTAGPGGQIRFYDNIITNCAGTFLNLGTSLSKFIHLSRNLVTVTSPNTFLSGTAGGANVSIAGFLGNNLFTGTGTYISTITNADVKWSFTDNTGITNTPAILNTAYTRTVSVTGVVLYVDSASTTSGVATFFPTSTGLVGGTALFSTIYSVQATARASAITAITVPFCSVNSISADKKIIKVNAIKGITIAPPAVGAATTTFVPNGTIIYLTIIGK